MKAVAEWIAIFLLVLVVYQDYKFKAISWFVFPLLFCVFLYGSLSYLSPTDLVNNFLIISVFLLLQGLLITLWFSFRQQKLINILRQYLGIGDVLFIVCMAVFFSPLNFLLFYVGSLLLIVLLTVLYKAFNGVQTPLIPLAGLQAAMLLLLILFNNIYSIVTFTSDMWLIRWLY